MSAVDLSLSPLLQLAKGSKTRCVLSRSDGETTVPGQAWIQLESTDFLPYLRKTHLTTELDRLAPYLWLVWPPSRKTFSLKYQLTQITTPAPSHISPLHHQETRGRRVIITEYPGLHAVWYYDRIYLKPIPPFMLCQAFWSYIKEADYEVWKASAGFMRTYCYLIQYEVDFRKATSPDLQLVPQPSEEAQLTYERFVQFIKQFEHLQDHEVSLRYRYGSIRLSRLNTLAFFLGKLSYFHVRPQWRDYFAHLLAPVITVSILVSIFLNSIQVGLAAQSLKDDAIWGSLINTSGWVAFCCLIFAASALLALIIIPGILLIKDVYFGLRMMKRFKSDPARARSMSSAVIG